MRVIRQLLTESVILAAAGGTLGVALAFVASGIVMRAIPANLTAWMAPSIDWRVLTFTLVVSMVSVVVLGMAPAFCLAGVAPAGALRGRSGLDPRGAAVQRGLVIAEIALSLVLLVGATLAVQSVRRLTQLTIKVQRARNVLTLRLSLQETRYTPIRARVARTFEQLDRRLKAIGCRGGQRRAVAHADRGLLLAVRYSPRRRAGQCARSYGDRQCRPRRSL